MSKRNKTGSKKRSWMIGGGMMLLVVCIGAGVLIASRANNFRQELEQANSGDIVAVIRGDLSAGATASGQIVAQRDARLATLASGTVETLLVQVGDKVEAGDPLMKLSTSELERSVESARQALLVQENNLAKMLAPATAADIAAAEASVASASAALASLLDGPTSNDLAAAEADLRAAEADVAAAVARLNELTQTASSDQIAAAQLELELAQTAATEAAQQHSTVLVTEPEGFLTQDRLDSLELSARTAALQANSRLAAAQETLDRLQNGDANSIAASQASVAAATAQRDVVQAQMDLLLAGASEAQIASAEANLAQAESTLDRLLQGASDAQIRMSEVAVEQAGLGLERAQLALDRATLEAPFAGTITAIYVNQGEQASGVVMELVDDLNMEVLLSVDEVDLANLAEGQPAVVTLETWPDVDINAEVATIAPSAADVGNSLVTYDVYLSLEESELPFLVGMSANAELITSQTEGVLLLPNAAINADRRAGTYSVNLVTGHGDDQMPEITETAVTIGLRDRQFTQVTSGLQEGDEVLIGDNLPVRRFGPGSDGPPQGRGPFG